MLSSVPPALNTKTSLLESVRQMISVEYEETRRRNSFVMIVDFDVKLTDITRPDFY